MRKSPAPISPMRFACFAFDGEKDLDRPSLPPYFVGTTLLVNFISKENSAMFV